MTYDMNSKENKLSFLCRHNRHKWNYVNPRRDRRNCLRKNCCKKERRIDGNWVEVDSFII